MLQRLFLLFLVCILSACSTTQVTLSTSEQSALKTEAIKSKKASPELLTEYENKANSLDLEALSLYSPRNIALAKNNAKAAKELLPTSTQENEIKAKYHLISALRSIDYASKNKMAV